MINAAERNVIEMADAMFAAVLRRDIHQISPVSDGWTSQADEDAADQEYCDRAATVDPTTVNGYDYQRQAWVKDGRYLRCGHPPTMDCRCYGLRHESEMISPGAIQDIH